MSDIDKPSETHLSHFRTPAGRLEELPLETDSSVDSEKGHCGCPVPFPFSEGNIAKQASECNVEFSSNTILSETAHVTTKHAIEYLEELAYNSFDDDKVEAVTSINDLLDNSVSLTRF